MKDEKMIGLGIGQSAGGEGMTLKQFCVCIGVLLAVMAAAWVFLP